MENNNNESVSVFGTLFVSSIKGFFMGILLTTILNIIPVLPARKRSTGNIMSRTFAVILFLPLSLLGLIVSPFLPRETRINFCDLGNKAQKWYEKTDLAW